MYKSVLLAAKSQLGQHNDRDGSNKYNLWYYGSRVVAPWCAVFIAWCFNQTGILDRLDGLTNKAGCDPFMRWAKSKNLWSGTPKSGALVLYDWDNDGSADHIGIVDTVGSGYIYAIEGNTSESGSQSNGGYVLRKKRWSGDILGYIHVDTTAPTNVFNIYGEGIVSSTFGCRINSRPAFGSATEELIPYNETVYCYGTNFNQGYEWWRVDQTGMRWVRKTSLKDRKVYKRRCAIIYGEGVVNPKLGVRIYSAPGKAYYTEEVIPEGKTLYCYGSNKKEGYEWWAVNYTRTKWVRKTSLRNRKGYKKMIDV